MHNIFHYVPFLNQKVSNRFVNVEWKTGERARAIKLGLVSVADTRLSTSVWENLVIFQTNWFLIRTNLLRGLHVITTLNFDPYRAACKSGEELIL